MECGPRRVRAGGTRRSDEFPTATVASRTTSFTTYKHVLIDPLDAYAATSTWVVVAHDLKTGAVQWTAKRQSRVYDSPLALDVSKDGHQLIVTGSAYDAFPVSATDSRITTVSYAADTGAEEWSAVWDGRPDGVDAGKNVQLSPDGRTVVVGGVTSVASGDLDYVLLGYDARTGERLWVDTAGLPGRDDALFGLAVDGKTAYATGWGAGSRGPYDADYLTIALDLRTGARRWTALYDGPQAGQSDRANAVAVDADGVYVTGDSRGVGSGSAYDYATVAYDLDGRQRWVSRYAGPTVGFNSPVAIAAAGGTVVVTGQSRGATVDDVRDFGTVAYATADGTERWRARYAATRSDEVAQALGLSPDGRTAYVTGSSRLSVPYTALDVQPVVAYRVADGQQSWLGTLEAPLGDAVRGWRWPCPRPAPWWPGSTPGPPTRVRAPPATSTTGR